MDLDEDDFVFFGTPIEREEEITSRKKKAVAEASGQLRTLPVWKQEVLTPTFPFLFFVFLPLCLVPRKVRRNQFIFHLNMKTVYLLKMEENFYELLKKSFLRFSCK